MTITSEDYALPEGDVLPNAGGFGETGVYAGRVSRSPTFSCGADAGDLEGCPRSVNAEYLAGWTSSGIAACSEFAFLLAPSPFFPYHYPIESLTPIYAV